MNEKLLYLLLPTYKRPERLRELLGELGRLIPRATGSIKLIVSVNDNCEKSKKICDECSSIFPCSLEVYSQKKLLTYDEQIFFLYSKVKLGSYVWFLGDKYEYSNFDFLYILKKIKEEKDFYVCKGRFYKVVNIKNLPYQRISKASGQWIPGRSDFFPQITMISSVIFRKKENSVYDKEITKKITNFSQVYLFLSQFQRASSFEELPYDFSSNRGGKSFTSYWNESAGLDALIWLNENFNFSFGQDLVFKASLMRGTKKNGFFRYWRSEREISEKFSIYILLIKSNPVNIFLPINSLLLLFKKAIVRCLIRR